MWAHLKGPCASSLLCSNVNIENIFDARFCFPGKRGARNAESLKIITPTRKKPKTVLPRPNNLDTLQSFIDNLGKEMPRPAKVYFTESFEGDKEHVPVRLAGKKARLCVYCLKKDVRTKGGLKVHTHFQCQKCLEPLCTLNERYCFVRYHKNKLSQTEEDSDNKSKS